MSYTDPKTGKIIYEGGDALPAVGSPEYIKSQGTVPSTRTVVTPTDSATNVNTNLDRSLGVGLLQKEKERQAEIANSYEKTRREADQYAAQMRQARIDAINATFAPRVQRETKAGEDRLSRVAALNFKAGTLGSGVDTTKTEGQKELNRGALQSIEDEKATAINEAFGWADQLARQRAEDTYNTRVKGAEANVAAAQGLYDTAIKSLQSFGKGGTTLESLKEADPDTYENLRKIGGLSDLQIASIMNENAPQPSNVNTEFKDGYLISSYFDPLTKKFKTYTEKLDLPEGVSSREIELVKADNGLIYAMDKSTGQVVNTIGERNPLYGQEKGTESKTKATPEETQTAKNEVASTYALAREITDKKGIFGRPATNSVTGIAQSPLSPGKAYLENQLRQLQGLLSLDARKKLKGSGAISDFEFKVLTESVSALGLTDESYKDVQTGKPVKGKISSTLSNAAFNREMRKITGALGSASGLEVPVKVTSPDGEVRETNLGSADITDAINQGFTVEYL